MTSILLLQIEDRKTELLTKFIQHNKKICNENDIRYVFMEKSDFHVPPYWQKIFELNKHMENNPEIEYAMWLDSDAILVNFTKSKMQNFLETHKDYSFIISKDMPPWDSEFNAGSFIVKNDDIGKKIMKDWLEKYNPDKWSYENSLWSTESAWAGIEYEQGSFVYYILGNPDYAKHILQLPYFTLNNNSCNSDNNDQNIASHLAGHFKEDKTIVDQCLEKIKSTVEAFTSVIKKNDCQYLFLVVLVLLLFLFGFSHFKKGGKRR
jgi:galactosyl transferase GMA12/MNN10 family